MGERKKCSRHPVSVSIERGEFKKLPKKTRIRVDEPNAFEHYADAFQLKRQHFSFLD
jgi:hypothetical protein